MYRDGADGIIDFHLAIEEEHRLDHQHSRHEPDDGRADRVTKAHGAVMATSPASMPLHSIDGSGFIRRGPIIHK